MIHKFNRFSNSLKKIFTAARFPQFSFKLMQIRAAEIHARATRLAKLRRPLVLPRDIVVRVTEKCFLRCKFCAQGGERGRVDRKNLEEEPVGPEIFRKIIDETSQWPVKPFIKITGGEPLVMGSPFLDVIQEMRERKFVVKLNTNGMLLRSSKIARRLVETDLNYLSISIDGNEQVHNELRGNPKLFSAIMEGIDNLKRLKKELGKKNLMILVSMVVSSETQDQIENVYHIAKNKNIDWFNVQFVNYTTPETCEQAHRHFSNTFGITNTPWDAFCNTRFNAIDPAFVHKQIENIISKPGNMPISVMGGLSGEEQIRKYYFTLEPIRQNICVLPFTGMHIVPPGKAIFCIDYPFYEYGDLREETIKSIWYGKRAEAFRVDMINYYRRNGLNFPQCARCNWRFN